MAGLKLLAAVLEPVGDEVMAKLMDAFAAAYALLAAAVTATLTLTLILIGATAGLGVRLVGWNGCAALEALCARPIAAATAALIVRLGG